MAAATVDVPGVGNVKKQYLYYGGAGLAAFIGYRWWTSGRDTGDETTTFGEGYDEFGNLLGEDPQMVSPGSPSGLTDRTPTVEPFAFNNNAEWSQWVIEYLTNVGGVPSGSALAAVGEYLARKPLSVQEQQWIRGAVAAAGPPPQGGPWDVIPEQPGTVTPTNTAPGGILGLRWTFVGPTVLELGWRPAANATQYRVTHTILSGTGKGTAGTRTVSSPSFRSTGLRRNSKHRFTIQALTASGRTGPSTSITGTTRRK